MLCLPGLWYMLHVLLVRVWERRRVVSFVKRKYVVIMYLYKPTARFFLLSAFGKLALWTSATARDTLVCRSARETLVTRGVCFCTVHAGSLRTS